MTTSRWLIGVALLTTGTLSGQEGPPSRKKRTAAAAAGNNEFALQLHARLRREGNLFFSPLSVRTALAMTAAGARNRTAAQMERALCLAVPGDHGHEARSLLIANLEAAARGSGCELNIANRLWGQKGKDFRAEFLRLLSRRYRAGMGRVDYIGATESARQTINACIAEQTRQRIPELIKPGLLDASTTLVLTNAIYFKSTWARSFDKKYTKDRPFHVLPAGDDVAATAPVVPTMFQKGTFGYYEDQDLQALELAYRGDALSMVLLLPRATHGLAALEASLDCKRLTRWVIGLHPKELMVFLPRFRMSSRFRLKAPLIALGMTDAFDPATADFSGMTGRKDQYISAVVHEAFVEVGEEGTEAAAATAVIKRKGGPRIARFHADHPFLFLIRDRRSGTILFLGRVADPTQGIPAQR